MRNCLDAKVLSQNPNRKRFDLANGRERERNGGKEEGMNSAILVNTWPRLGEFKFKPDVIEGTGAQKIGGTV